MPKKSDKVVSNKSIREQIRANKAKEFLDDDITEDTVLEEIRISDKKQVSATKDEKMAKLAKLEKIEKDIDELKVNAMSIREFLEKHKDVPVLKQDKQENIQITQIAPNMRVEPIQNVQPVQSGGKDYLAELKKNKISFA